MDWSVLPKFGFGLIFFSFAVGVIARAITPGRGPKGIIMTFLLGLAGSVLARYTVYAYASQNMGALPTWGKWAQGWVGAIIGAVLLCVLWHIVTGFTQKKSNNA